MTQYIHHMNTIKIKMEVDTDPPGDFTTETKRLLLPIPFTVLTMTQEDLFAGKIHALLCRNWQKRIKGRDWYDYYWYISRGVAVNLSHLAARLRQSDAWPDSKPLTHEDLVELLDIKIKQIDYNSAKADVIDFLKNKSAVDLWSQEFFTDITKQLKSVRRNA